MLCVLAPEKVSLLVCICPGATWLWGSTLKGARFLFYLQNSCCLSIASDIRAMLPWNEWKFGKVMRESTKGEELIMPPSKATKCSN